MANFITKNEKVAVLHSPLVEENKENIVQIIDYNSIFRILNEPNDTTQCMEIHTTQVENEANNLNDIYIANNTESIIIPTKRPKITETKRKLMSVIEHNEETKILDGLELVKKRLHNGCACRNKNCFREFNPEKVYEHRLNIKKLTLREHDMYLMGVTMTCLYMNIPDMTGIGKNICRQRYVYQGRTVCLNAFLFLENCTRSHIARIRQHVVNNGVIPRVPEISNTESNNSASSDVFHHAIKFVRQYLATCAGKLEVKNKENIKLPFNVNKLYEIYKKYGVQKSEKFMNYITFSEFMADHFPNVQFCNTENNHHNIQKYTEQNYNQELQQLIQQSLMVDEKAQETNNELFIINENYQQHTLPNIAEATQFSSDVRAMNEKQVCNIESNPAYPYELKNCEYLIDNQASIVTVMMNYEYAQHPNLFNTM